MEVKISWWVCISIHHSFCFQLLLLLNLKMAWGEIAYWLSASKRCPEMIWETFFMPFYLSHLGCILLSQDYLGVLYMSDEKQFFPYSQLLATLKNVQQLCEACLCSLIERLCFSGHIVKLNSLSFDHLWQKFSAQNNKGHQTEDSWWLSSHSP